MSNLINNLHLIMNPNSNRLKVTRAHICATNHIVCSFYLIQFSRITYTLFSNSQI